MKSCTFIGHRDCTDDIKEKLCSVIEHLILSYNVRIFYVGTHGNFDRLVYSILCDLESKYDIKTKVVLAYLNVGNNKMYDTEKTVFPHYIDVAPKKYAIIKRNEYMIEHSEFLVCYLNNTFSNTYRFLEYAKTRKIEIINIGDLRI